MSEEMTWKEAARRVLAESSEPMHYSEIMDKILKSGFRKNGSKASVNHAINRSIRKEGRKSPFAMGVKDGVYTLRENLHSLTSGVSPKAAKTPKVAKTLKVKKAVKRRKKGGKQDVASIISSFGLKWDKSLVDWRDPKDGGKELLQGMKSGKNNPINFWNQRGIYLLYDSEGKVVYAGLSGLARKTGGIGDRLSKHARDTHREKKWEKFSWFGFREVSNLASIENSFCDVPEKASETCRMEDLIRILEAIFIEALDLTKKLNDNKGYGLKGREYEQIKST